MYRNATLYALAAAAGAKIVRVNDIETIRGHEFSKIWIDEADDIGKASEFVKRWNTEPNPLTAFDLNKFLEPAPIKEPDYHHKDLKRAVLGKKQSRWK